MIKQKGIVAQIVKNIYLCMRLRSKVWFPPSFNIACKGIAVVYVDLLVIEALLNTIELKMMNYRTR